jgi:uncharacterized protein YjbJ (UPF0337 family)
MRRLFSLIACALSVGLVSAANPNDSPSATSSATILALVDQLGAEGFADREAASAKLEIIGIPAVDALRAATRSESPEVRDRAINILDKIQRVAESANRLRAKTVTLSYKDVSLGSAFNDLKTRTGLNIVLDPNRISNPLRKITCETKELPVWEALEAFCTAAELREVFVAELETRKPQTPRRGYVPPPLPPNADAVPLVLVDGKPDRIVGERSSAVRVLALPPTFPGHKVTLGTGEVNLCLDVTPAPGLGWQEVSAVKVSRVIDFFGRSGGAGTEKNPVPNFDPNGVIMFARPGVAFRFDSNGNTVLPETQQNPRIVQIPIRIGTPTATSLKRLEGMVFGEIQIQNQQLIAVTDLKRNTNTAITGPGELRFTILELKETPGELKETPGELKEASGKLKETPGELKEASGKLKEASGKLKEAPGTGGLGTVRVQLEYPPPWLTNARRRGGFNPGWPEAPLIPKQGYRVEAFDAAGKPFPLLGGSSFMDTSDDGMVVIQTLHFNFNSGLPAKLVVVGPKTVNVQVPFALENVPLP